MSDDHEVLVRKAARALSRSGLVHAYGHCSARIDAASFLVCAAKPMGMIGTGEPGTRVPIDGPLPEGVLGEVRIHQQIYRRRPEVGGICRVMPPHVMALSTMRRTPRARHGLGAYFAPEPPLWDDPLLLRSDEQASQLADLLGPGRAIVMRGNGAVTAGETLETAVVFAWYLEDAARVELEVLRCAADQSAPTLTPAEVEVRAVGTGRIYERMWDYLCDGDPE
ncbi:MAG: class II aldolase/adducin family protein [Alphaproteobacteria bacterium]|nr:class II aldolase/adducin family protein [Alphaproteobacteria bacterium]